MKILAVDLGDARTGLAVCDPTELIDHCHRWRTVAFEESLSGRTPSRYPVAAQFFRKA